MDALSSSNACFKGPTTTIPTPNAFPRSVAVTLAAKIQSVLEHIRGKTFVCVSSRIVHLTGVCFREATEGLYSGQEAMTSPDSAIAIL